MNTTLKTLNATEGRIGGYLVIWGSPDQRDLQGEFFTPDTDLGLTWYPRRPVLYHHGLDGSLKAAVIGVIDRLMPDDTGLWAEAQLDMRQRYVRTVQRLIDKGALGWSSGSLPHLVEVADDGQIKRWPIVEGSLTPAPAEPRRTDVHTLKSAYEALGLDMRRLAIAENDAGRGNLPGRLYADDPATHEMDYPGEETMHDETLPMNEDERPARKRLPIASTNDAAQRPDALKAAPIVVGSRFDNLDEIDLLHGYMLLRSTKNFHGVSEQYANALAHKVQKAGLTAIKSNELATSTQAGFGDEWVPDLWSAQIWQKARLENVILPLFRSIEMPSNPFELPIEGTDPTVYFVPETSDETQLTLAGSGNPIPDSKVASGKVQLAAKKLALRVGFSAELVEDSIIPVLNIYRDQAMKAITSSIDYVLLNGDTASSGNINKDTGTPAATDRYMAFDGLRKLPLVTNTANASDAGNAAPDLTKLRTARFKMDTRYAARPSDLAWIVDGGTYAKFLAMSEFLTMDKAGPLATAQTGQIGFVDGAPVLVSAEMPLTYSSGKVNIAQTNDRGQAVCVYRPGWFVGYRRKIAISVDYLPYYDSYQLTATVRLAFINFDSEPAAVLYNIAV